MELDELREILDLLRGTDITELEFERDGARIRVKRGSQPVSVEISGRPAEAVSEAEVAQEETSSLITVTAPLVGTFYRAPSPDAPYFAEVGDRVKKGQVLCIIEAMKLMNEIESEADGTIVKVLVENAHPVEYGEPLFLIEPA